MIPNNISDTERDVSDKEAKQTVMHCSFSVISACNDVDVIAYGRQNNDSVDTESYSESNMNLTRLLFVFNCPTGAVDVC